MEVKKYVSKIYIFLCWSKTWKKYLLNELHYVLSIIYT